MEKDEEEIKNVIEDATDETEKELTNNKGD